jgi:hypothetical protein
MRILSKSQVDQIVDLLWDMMLRSFEIHNSKAVARDVCITGEPDHSTDHEDFHQL